MRSYQERTNLRYTLVFDYFSLPDLLACTSELGKEYTKSLIDKGAIDRDLIQSDWIDSITAKRDIFVNKIVSTARTIKVVDWKQQLEGIKNSDSINTTHIDYRFSTIEITPIEEKLILSTNTPMGMISNRSIAGERLVAELLGTGIVRLFRDSDGYLNESQITDKQLTSVPGDNTTVAILAVPFYFTASDLLLGFFDQEDTSKISHLRLVKSSSPNRYMLLLKLRSQESVTLFLRKYQGRKFNSFEPEKCSIIEIKEIIFRSREEKAMLRITGSLPYLLKDPFTDKNTPTLDTKSGNYTELATCPVCLDRLDSTTTGLFTIPCQHTYHSSCLSKWKDDTCPVCRYSNRAKTKTNIDHESLNECIADGSDETEKCTTCHSTENLWICLICGNVGCGRYNDKHAIHHWENTGHCFAMETNTQRVWDYSSDGYVHRLVQNEADGKVVELPLRDESKKTNDEKVDKIGFEYSKMLIEQLENQRQHYEEKMEKLSMQVKRDAEFIEKLRSTESKINDYETELRKLRDDNKQAMIIGKKNLTEAIERSTKLSELNSTFIKTLKEVKIQNDILAGENLDLKEQVTDLMFYLQSQQKFENAPKEVKEGTIVTYKESPK